VDFALNLEEGTTVTLLAPLIPAHGRKLKEELSLLLQKGFVRVVFGDSMQKIEAIIDDKAVANKDLQDGEVLIVVDRVRVEQAMIQSIDFLTLSKQVFRR
jgi:excinuclease ABC subunit A